MLWESTKFLSACWNLKFELISTWYAPSFTGDQQYKYFGHNNGNRQHAGWSNSHVPWDLVEIQLKSRLLLFSLVYSWPQCALCCRFCNLPHVRKLWCCPMQTTWLGCSKQKFHDCVLLILLEEISSLRYVVSASGSDAKKAPFFGKACMLNFIHR